jgi:signal transduction histidine kinase/CheY-like chemotaxis protein/HPt (histidine-containing phosphotransfer) domain-containing protein
MIHSLLKCRCLLILLAQLPALFSAAQFNLDSLKSQWNNQTLPDSIREQAFREIAFHSGMMEVDTLLIYSEQGYQYGVKTSSQDFIGYAQLMRAVYYTLMGNFDSLIVHTDTCLTTLHDTKDFGLLALMNSMTAYAYVNLSDFSKSLYFAQKAHQLAQKSGNNTIVGSSLNILGVHYFNVNNFERSLFYWDQALALTKDKNDLVSSGIIMNMGNAYGELKDNKKAIEYYKMALSLIPKTKNDQSSSIIYLNLGEAYKIEGDYTTSKMYILKSIEFNEGIQNPFLLGYCYETLSAIGNLTKDYPSAIQYGIKSLEMGKVAEYVEVQKRAADQLYMAHKAIGNIPKALFYHELLLTMSDSLNSLKTTKELQQMELAREALLDSIGQAKEKQIIQTRHNEELHKNTQTRNVALGSGAILLLLVGGLVNRIRFIRKSQMLLQKEKNKAEQSEKFKQQFLANMSHEIRTPMNAVMGMTNLLIDNQPTEEQFRYLDGIKKSSDNLLHIINDILDLSKIEAGKMEIEYVDFSLPELAEQMKNILQFRANEKELELYNVIDAEVPDIVIGDPSRILQVLINLVGNAIKFTEYGSVAVELSSNDTGIKFTITDTGIGIPEDKLQSVFESFTQANTTDTRLHGGTGLGLSISKHLVELMGGHLTIKSVEGSGSTFSFILPLEKGSSEKLKERLTLEHSIDGHILDGLRILITDDNEYNRIVATDTLKSKANVEIREATNGQEAIELVKNNVFDIILMDVQMPVMNGFDATRYIRSQGTDQAKKIPIIALTASVLRTDLDKCLEAGMNSYIPKPFNPQQLIIGIANVLKIPLQAKTVSTSIAEKHIASARFTDLTYLEKFCEGDPARMKKYIHLFTTSVPNFIAHVVAALENEDYKELGGQIHSFKTKSMMMGMRETRALSITLEQMCREGAAPVSIKENVEQLIAQIESACSELSAI